MNSLLIPLKGPSRGPRVQGCRELEVASPKDLLRLARLGASQRHVAATKMNDRSSRTVQEGPLIGDPVRITGKPKKQ